MNAETDATPGITLTAAAAAGKPGKHLVVAARGDEQLHRNVFDLNSEFSRNGFVAKTLQAAHPDARGPDDWPADERAALTKTLLAFAAAPPGPAEAPPPAEPAPDDDPRREALADMPADVVADAQRMLDAPGLFERVAKDIEAVGVVGEVGVALTLYLAGTSAQLPRPVSVITRGVTSSGKSFVADRVFSLFPGEVVLRATSITCQALYYFPPGTLRHRVVVAGERSRAQDDDTAEATRALREMIEAGRLTKAVPRREPDGRLVTDLVEQQGPIAFVESTTVANLFDEDANRCLILQTDEQEEQTRKVLRATAKAAAGGRAGAAADRVRLVHHALQRMVPRADVVVPFAGAAAELFPAARVDARRNFRHFLALIKAHALLHFRQRDRDPEGRVVATKDDYVQAAALAAGPLGLAGGGVTDGAGRFLGRLAGWFGDGEFTTSEAKGKGEFGKTTVHGWLIELAEAGLVEQTDPGKGRMPARWKRTGAGPDNRSGLPSWEQVEAAWSGRTGGRDAEPDGG